MGLISYYLVENKNTFTLAGAAVLDDFCILEVLILKAKTPLLLC